MGIWEFIGSTAETVKRNAPDTTPLKNACRTSYTYGSAAVTQIDKAVRINGLYRLGQWTPDDVTRSKMVLYTTKFAKNAWGYFLQEGFKLIPGGSAFSNILTKTLEDVEHENLEVEKLNMSEDKIRAPPKNFSGGRKLIETHSRGGGEAVSDDIRVVSAADKEAQTRTRRYGHDATQTRRHSKL